jgi:sodium/potassium-transporting ATPase subunit alpha
MKIRQLHIEEALHSFHSSITGLSDHEAQNRLGEFGPNLVERIREEHLVLKLLEEFTYFFAIVLWLAAGLAFFAEWSEPGQGMLTLGFAIVGVIVINGLFSFWQEYRAEKAIATLQKLLPQLVEVLREGKTAQIQASQLGPGDIIFLSEGDNIPADCRLAEAFGVRVNNATVTGESLPKARDTHESLEEELIHAKNVVLAGTSVVSGNAKALVFATGMRTELGKIAHLTQTSGEMPSPLQKEIAYVSRIVAVLAVGLGILFFFIAPEVFSILLIDYTPWGNRIFGTAPISWDVWYFMVLFAVGMVVVEETRKWIYRRIRFSQ